MSNLIETVVELHRERLRSIVEDINKENVSFVNTMRSIEKIPVGYEVLKEDLRLKEYRRHGNAMRELRKRSDNNDKWYSDFLKRLPNIEEESEADE